MVVDVRLVGGITVFWYRNIVVKCWFDARALLV